MAKRAVLKKLRERITKIGDVQKGTWLTHALQKLLKTHVETANAEFFKKKYPGLNREKIAERLIGSAAHYAGLAGASAAGAITLAELAAPESGGASLAAGATAFVGELTSTTYLQLKMIYNISVILGAPLDPADPEDLMTMFWYALGIQKWQETANAVLSAGPRSTEYLGRKALRSGIRAALQRVATKFGGQQLARQLTERACLRLLVPGVNMPVAYLANKAFTRKLGRIAITRLRHRAAIVPAVMNLEKEDRDIQLLALPIIFHIGIALEESAEASRTIELQDTVARKLKLSSDERDAVFDLIEIRYSEFLQSLKRRNLTFRTDALGDLAIAAHVFSDAHQSRSRLRQISEDSGIGIDSNRIRRFKKRVARD